MIIISDKRIYSVLIVLTLAFSTIRIFFGNLSLLVLGTEIIGKLFFYAIYFLVFLFSYTYIFPSVKKRYILVGIGWFIYCVIMAITTKQDTAGYLSLIKYIVVFGSLYFIIGQSISRNAVIIRKTICYMPAILNIFGLVNYFISRRVSVAIQSADYSMEQTYANLVNALICIVILFAGDLEKNDFSRELPWYCKGKWFYIINLLFSTILILLGGSRGPILAMALVLVFSFFYSLTKRKNISTIILFVLLMCTCCFFLLFYIEVNRGETVGVDSSIRIVNMISEGNMIQLSGRDKYIEISLKGIQENKLYGLGVFHDRIYIYNLFHRSYTLNSLGSYSHNIFLEIILQFGIPIGAIVIIVLMFLIIQGYIRSVQREEVEVYLLLVGIGLFPLLVSKSYVQSWEFYLLLGYLLQNDKKIGKWHE